MLSEAELQAKREHKHSRRFAGVKRKHDRQWPGERREWGEMVSRLTEVVVPRTVAPCPCDHHTRPELPKVPKAGLRSRVLNFVKRVFGK
jgi:hypothetical protein